MPFGSLLAVGLVYENEMVISRHQSDERLQESQSNLRFWRRYDFSHIEVKKLMKFD